MPVQTSYTPQLKGFAGQLVGIGHQTRTGLNDTGSVAQEDDLTVDTAAAGTYQYEIDGAAVTYVADGSDTVTTIRDGLIAALRADSQFEDLVSANPVGAATARFTALVKGTGYTLTETDANLSTASVTVNTATQNVPFGYAVVRGSSTAERSAALPSAAAEEFLGVNERILSDVGINEPKDATRAFAAMSLVHSGIILVKVEGAVAAGDDVFFRHTAGAGGTVLGEFRNDADTATADQVVGAKFRTATNGAGIAEVSLNGA